MKTHQVYNSKLKTRAREGKRKRQKKSMKVTKVTMLFRASKKEMFHKIWLSYKP